jgi:phage baseplate assembly protein W
MIYRGFSTYNRIRKFRTTDFDLVKQDIFNHFNIRKGEKLMNPEFGTNIWNYLFDPMTQDVKQQIVDDVKAICAYEPRVRLDDILVNTYQHGVNIQLTLTYIQENQVDLLALNFDSRYASPTLLT